MPSRLVGPDPYIVLLGCRPWSASEERKPVCPICHGSTSLERKQLMVCARCNTVSAPLGRLIVARELGNPESGRRQRAERTDVKIRDDLARRHHVLDETTRRLIWNGYKGVFSHEITEPCNLAKIGREWLRSIKQEPRWHLSVETVAVMDAAG